ncbi:MAG: hypothetical protein KDD15_33070, partial [Lewinella sp.]|nr:hypothetical protein [Lewinella sp.]
WLTLNSSDRFSEFIDWVYSSIAIGFEPTVISLFPWTSGNILHFSGGADNWSVQVADFLFQDSDPAEALDAGDEIIEFGNALKEQEEEEEGEEGEEEGEEEDEWEDDEWDEDDEWEDDEDFWDELGDFLDELGDFLSDLWDDILDWFKSDDGSSK